ncbi:hypothetical protein HNY73_005345 [Argiope bruennichi]|uniref:Uncharacterized protein n=1 Tax=Argiope bruennichi TaxID=94029 RepID=A0A8T0FG71_ARGBR|nr:hypothetical protein HNY73_005345 [Argiope bruennichi]
MRILDETSKGPKRNGNVSWVYACMCKLPIHPWRYTGALKGRFRYPATC